MKRNKAKPGEIRWRKDGGGSFYMRKNGKVKIIKPGQIFLASPDDIPEAFRDVVVPVEGEELKTLQKKDAKAAKKATVYSLKHKGGGKYIVEDGEEKQINEGTLTKKEAEELIETLS